MEQSRDTNKKTVIRTDMTSAVMVGALRAYRHRHQSSSQALRKVSSEVTL